MVTFLWKCAECGVKEWELCLMFEERVDFKVKAQGNFSLLLQNDRLSTAMS